MICPTCHKTRPTTQITETGICTYCKRQITTENDPDYMPTRRRKTAAARARRLATKYGLTVEQHARMLTEQAGLCAICDQPGALFIDHDHATGAVRALLCPPCNSGLGHFQDDPETLRRAAAYLNQHHPLETAT